MRNFTIFLLIIFAVTACKNNTNEINTIDVSNINDNINLSLTDIVKDIRIVCLENKDGILIPDCKYYINENYIVTQDKDKVVQFSSLDGKYIRTLMVAGSGPNEFVQIVSAGIYNDKYYYSTNANGAIKSVCLSNGEFGKEFFVYQDEDKKAYFSKITPNGELVFRNDSCLLSLYNLNTNKLTEVMEYKKSEAPSIEIVNFSLSDSFAFADNNEGSYVFNSCYSDTIYYIQNNRSFPISVVKLPPVKELGGEKLMGLSSQEAVNVNFPLVYENNLLIQTSFSTLAVTSNSLSIGKRGLDLIILNTKDKSVCKVDEFIFNPLFEIVYKDKDGVGMFNSLSMSYNNYFGPSLIGFAFPAFELKEDIEKNLEDSSISDKVKEKLRKLDNSLTEDSNPIIVMGKLK